MDKIYNKKEECSGCTACLSVCSKKAITMVEDKEGFLYPKVDKKLCINCGACIKVCHLKDNKYKILKNNNLESIAFKHKSSEVLYNSSSGGAFTAISDYILKNKGQVYGVVFNNEMKVIHSVANNVDERNKMRGSKYVQSDIRGIFKEIKQSLKETDKFIMFQGTPCQVAGLKSYLGDNINSERLLLCDIVCHGVTSPLFWREHINFIEKKYKRKILNYKFRSKIRGWGYHIEGFSFDNKKFNTKSALSQAYKNIFYTENAFRPSCYNCKYTDVNRVSDITIADFWGLQKTMPEFFDRKGVSLILINTEKGNDVFNNIKNNCEYRKCHLKDCMQPQLQAPIKMPDNRQKFWEDYINRGYKFILKKYTCYGGLKRIKFEIKKCVPNNIKKKIMLIKNK